MLSLAWPVEGVFGLILWRNQDTKVQHRSGDARLEAWFPI